MPQPKCRLEKDGKHFLWSHDCLITWTKEPLEQELVREEIRLPINAEYGWVVQSTEPLTITPSILCSGCGTHGFFTDGKWVAV